MARGPRLLILLWLAGMHTGLPAAEPADSPDRPAVGLVLSGGGARGAAHVGVIKVLDQLQIPVDYVAGTSMGAIVGGLYASGMSADELSEVIETVDWNGWLTDRPPRPQRSFRRKTDDLGFLVDFDVGIDGSGLIFPAGFVQGQNLELALRRLSMSAITVDDFDRLPVPFRAIATDIVNGEAVVLGSGDLTTAMRASMSAPGIFKPVEIDGRKLVDGGVANNLPVQAVLDMGADVLIVVDVGFPLLAEEELDSALAVTKQMLTILINGRAQDELARLRTEDVLIAPDLGNLGSQEFHRMVEALALGEAKALEESESLARLAVGAEEYQAYRNRIRRQRNDVPVVDKLVVETESRLSPRVIESRLTDPVGKALNPDQLEIDLSDVYGLNTFETVSYDVFSDSGFNTLYIRATERSWGPNYLRFGINLEDDFSGNSNYNLAARLTRTELNQLGGEFRAEVQIGETPRVFMEFFQPLDYQSRWFVNPEFEFARVGIDVFDNGGIQLAKLGSDSTRIALDVGRQFANWGEFRFGVQTLHADVDQRIGPPELAGGSAEINSFAARFSLDTIDRVAVPRSGTSLDLEWTGARESIGSDSTFDLLGVGFLTAQTWGKNTLFHWWEAGSTVKEDSGNLSPFSLGGLFSLSGYAPDELSGRHAAIGRLLYYRRLGDQLLPVFDTSVYLGASIELGNVWQDSDEIAFDNTLTAGSVFVVFDSLLGPLYIAYGAAEGGRRSAYLFLGQTF